MGGRGARSHLGGGGGGGVGGRDLTKLQKGNPATIVEALERVNPHYFENTKWQINCQRCVWAYELQRRGYDVEALPAGDPSTDTLPWDWTPRSWNEVMENPRGSYVDLASPNDYDVLDKIDRAMQQWGEGARAFVRVAWKQGGGHVFVAEYNGGVVNFYDPQVGHTNPTNQGYYVGGFIDVYHYMSQAYTDRGIYMLRSDNAKLTDLIDEAVRARKKGRTR